MSREATAPLEEWMESIIDYRGKTPTKTDSGVPLVTAKIIKSGRIDTPSEFIAEEDYEEWMRRGIPKGGDVVITTEAPLGEVAQLPNLKIALAQRVITLRGKQGVVDNTYLKYLLLSSEFQHDLESRATGTTVFGIKQSVLRKIELSFPDFGEQKGIAHILGTLDDKIELNRKTNETLEGIAKALFKSWFVDFDPVRAKAEGRPTGLPDEISELFPDSFEESELGEIPSGWSCSSVYDLADYVNGASHSSKTLNDNRLGYPVIKINELKNGFTDQTKYWDADYKEKHLVTNGDILFSWSGNPDTSIGTFVWSRQDGLLNQHIFKVVPRESEWRSFVLSMLRSNQKTFADIARDKQTTGLGHVTVKDLKEMMCPIASVTVMTKFSSLADALFERCQNLVLQIDALEVLRDALLPRLISGELRVPDAEKMLEEVGI